MAKVKKLIIDQLQVKLGKKVIIPKFSLSLATGKITALMGVNGSGKSTIAKAIMGHPDYAVRGRILWQGKNIIKQASWQRARAGLMMSWQHPLEIPGVNFYELLLTTFSANYGNNQQAMFDSRLQQGLKILKLKENFLERDLNVGFSGGEKKKAELLQLFVLRPQLVILDEIDSGLDIDAVKIIAQAIKYLAKRGVGFLIITHYARLLNFVRPQVVQVLINGQLVAKGNFALVQKLEKQGYGWLESKVK